MSYFSHNPEAYSKIERDAIAEKLTAHMQEPALTEMLSEALEELELSNPDLFRALSAYADAEVERNTGEFFTALAVEVAPGIRGRRIRV